VSFHAESYREFGQLPKVFRVISFGRVRARHTRTPKARVWGCAGEVVLRRLLPVYGHLGASRGRFRPPLARTSARHAESNMRSTIEHVFVRNRVRENTRSMRSESHSEWSRSSLPRSSLPRSCLPRSSLPRSCLPRSCLPRSCLPRSSLPRSSLPRSSLPRSSLPRSSLLANDSGPYHRSRGRCRAEGMSATLRLPWLSHRASRQAGIRCSAFRHRRA